MKRDHVVDGRFSTAQKVDVNVLKKPLTTVDKRCSSGLGLSVPHCDQAD